MDQAVVGRIIEEVGTRNGTVILGCEEKGSKLEISFRKPIPCEEKAGCVFSLEGRFLMDIPGDSILDFADLVDVELRDIFRVVSRGFERQHS